MLAAMKCLFPLLLAAASAMADSMVLTSRAWRVEGAMDSGPNPRDIHVAVDRQPVGTHSELKVFFNFDGTNWQQIFSIKGEGTIQPIVPPPVVAGGTFRLTSYRDCVEGLVPPLQFTDLEFRSSNSRRAPLRAKGRLSNFDSLVGTDLRMKFYAPDTNAVAVELKYKLRAARDFCVDRAFEKEEDEFRLAEMRANFTSAQSNQNTRLRYIRIKDRICPVISDCVTTKESFCADLDNVTGYLFGKPRRLGDPSVQLLHTNAVPQNTPSLQIEFHSPPHGRVKPQAWIEPTDDPTEPNVAAWGNWVKARRFYREGRPVTRVRVVLKARDPSNPHCDELRRPTPP
jgi:hypothetical protein